MNIDITLALQEIATINANFEAERAKNESLKRMKVCSNSNALSTFYVYSESTT